MGTIVDKTYSIGTASLRVTSLQIAADSTPSYSAPTELFSNIVNLKAMYGKETTGAALGMVDTWDNVTPTTNAGWRQVVAVRLAIVARSATYEKDEVTAANPTWDVGSTGVAALAGLATCPSGTSKCLSLKVDTPTDWQHYRYKVFDTVIPLRNMLWNS
jgi:type IV pilus assembly protein PilW